MPLSNIPIRAYKNWETFCVFFIPIVVGANLYLLIYVSINSKKNILTMLICVLCFLIPMEKRELNSSVHQYLNADYRCWQLRHADGGTLECGHDKGEIRNSATKEELISSPKSTLSLSTLRW